MARRIGDVGWVLEHLHDTYGPVVEVGYRVPLRVVCVFGPEANRHVLSDHPEDFTWKEAFRLLEVVDGPTALGVSDGAEHRRRRRLVQPAFSVARVNAHLDLVVAEIDRTLAGWTAGRHLDAYAELRSAVRRIAVRALVGERLGDLADEIGRRLEPALAYVQRSPATRFDVNLRWNAYGRARAATRAVDELLLAEIARRRAEGVDAGAHPDTLSALLVAADEAECTDEPLDDTELCDQVRSLVAAGYDTTSAAAAWLVHSLGSHPDAMAALRTQVRDVLGDRPPTVEDLRALPLVDGVVRETLRLWPPGPVAGRQVVADTEMLGHHVSGGTLLLYSPYITHRLPEVWGDPEVFRPERWADGEPEPFSFVPFGGGYRRCIGFALATLELQVLAVRLVQRVGWRLDRLDTRGAGTATFAPKGGVPLTVTDGLGPGS